MKKTQAKKYVKTILDVILKVDANTASSCFAHQDKMPSQIKKFKKVQ